MDRDLLARLTDLVLKTGDRVVFADSQTGKAVVIIDLPSYEKLVGSDAPEPQAPPKPEPKPAPTDLTPPETADKMKRDVGLWKTAKERRTKQEMPPFTPPAPVFAPVDKLEEEERFYLEPLE